MRFVRISGKLHPSSERGVIRSSTLVANHCCRTGGRVSCRKVGVRLCTMRVRRHRSVRIDLNSSSLPPGFLDCHAIDLAEFNDVIVVDSTIRNQSTGIARSRCELLDFGVAPAGGALVPGASVVGEGPGAGGGGDVVGVGGVDLDVVHRPAGRTRVTRAAGPSASRRTSPGRRSPAGTKPLPWAYRGWATSHEQELIPLVPALRVQGVGPMVLVIATGGQPCPARTGGGRRWRPARRGRWTRAWCPRPGG